MNRCMKWLRENKKRVESWIREIARQKLELLKFGVRTWEFYVLGITFVAVLFSPLFLPGLYAAEDTTPDSKPYGTTIVTGEGTDKTTYIDVDCQSDNFITAGRIAYLCKFRFEQSDGSLQRFENEYIQYAIERTILIKDWSRRKNATRKVKQGRYLPLRGDFLHQTEGGSYTIHGQFRVVAPNSPEIYSFSIGLSGFFGGKFGDSQKVTVYSPTEASTLETREFLMPFRRLIVIGIALSLVKLWIELLDRIAEKKQE